MMDGLILVVDIIDFMDALYHALLFHKILQ